MWLLKVLYGHALDVHDQKWLLRFAFTYFLSLRLFMTSKSEFWQSVTQQIWGILVGYWSQTYIISNLLIFYMKSLDFGFLINVELHTYIVRLETLEGSIGQLLKWTKMHVSIAMCTYMHLLLHIVPYVIVHQEMVRVAFLFAYIGGSYAASESSSYN